MARESNTECELIQIWWIHGREKNLDSLGNFRESLTVKITHTATMIKMWLKRQSQLEVKTFSSARMHSVHLNDLELRVTCSNSCSLATYLLLNLRGLYEKLVQLFSVWFIPGQRPVVMRWHPQLPSQAGVSPNTTPTSLSLPLLKLEKEANILGRLLWMPGLGWLMKLSTGKLWKI